MKTTKRITIDVDALILVQYKSILRKKGMMFKKYTSAMVTKMLENYIAKEAQHDKQSDMS